MSTLRGRIERLAQMAAQTGPEPPRLVVERFGEDDFGGGWRGPPEQPGPAANVLARPALMQEVMFDMSEGVGEG